LLFFLIITFYRTKNFFPNERKEKEKENRKELLRNISVLKIKEINTDIED